MCIQWVEKKEFGPYSGLLIVMNIGRDNEKKIPNISNEYLDTVMDEVNKAHAAGMAVFYLFDNEIPYSMPPEHFDFLEDYDHVRPVSLYVPALNFSLMYDMRMKQVRALAGKIFEDKTFCFDGSKLACIGFCRIAGDPVLIPVCR